MFLLKMLFMQSSIPSHLRHVFVKAVAFASVSTLFIASAFTQETERWQYPQLEHRISIRDGRQGDRLSWDEFSQRLTTANVVFLGESHDDDTTHQLQLAVYEALLGSRDGNVVLAMEMFERDVQSALDLYLSGKMDEKAFLEKSRPWGNYIEAYRPLIERAKADNKKVIASNFPRPLRVKLMQSDAKSLDGLSDDRGLAPEKLFPNSELYWKRTDNATRGHSAFMTVETDEQSRLMSTQSLWDNSMGESIVKSLDENPDHAVLHLNGGFHSEYWDGTAGQVRQRKPDAKIVTIAAVPSSNPHSAELTGEPVADFVVFVENKAKNLNDGKRAVVVNRESNYQLYLPSWASEERKAPLLIWLNDDGLSAEDGLNYWKMVLKDQAAIAVIEPTHRQFERDFSIGGRWFWPDRFPADVATGRQSIEGVWQYVLNRFPVDPDRVCLAGEGTGATLCSAVTLLTGKMNVQGIAIGPRQFSKIKDFPLPLVEDWGSETPPERQLHVIAHEQDQDWWQSELKEYEGVGLKTRYGNLETNAWLNEHQFHSAVFEALGLEPLKPDFSRIRKYVVSRYGTAKEKHWLRTYAWRHSDDKTHTAVVDERRAAGFTDIEKLDDTITVDMIRKGSVPRCPGPFGGTTILVLGEGQAEESEPWLDLEINDPLTALSRFHRVRIAVLGEGDRSLANVLQKLQSENRKNVLIVPAEFYAGDEVLKNLERAAEPFTDQMTIQWLPGLGGEMK